MKEKEEGREGEARVRCGREEGKEEGWRREKTGGG